MPTTSNSINCCYIIILYVYSCWTYNSILRIVITELKATAGSLDTDLIFVLDEPYFVLLIKNTINKMDGQYNKKKDIKKENISNNLNIDIDRDIVTSNNKDETHMVNLFDNDLSNFDNIEYDTK